MINYLNNILTFILLLDFLQRRLPKQASKINNLGSNIYILIYSYIEVQMKKIGIKSPDDLDDDKKKEFFNYVDKNYKAKAEGRVKEGGPGSGRPTKPGSARDIDKKMMSAADAANAKMDAAEKAMRRKK